MDNEKPDKRRILRIVILCLAAAALTACVLLTFLFRRTPEKAVRQMMEEYGYHDIRILRDYAGNDRVAAAVRALNQQGAGHIM